MIERFDPATLYLIEDVRTARGGYRQWAAPPVDNAKGAKGGMEANPSASEEAYAVRSAPVASHRRPLERTSGPPPPARG